MASWSYDSSTREMISYDTPANVDLKIGFIKQSALGGGMWWDASGDRPANGTGSLIKQVVQGLGSVEKCDNVLNYPDSKYDNLRNGMPSS